MKVLWLIVVLVAGCMIWFRAAPTDPAQWHVVPEDVTARPKPNDWLRAAVAGADGAPALFAASPDAVAAALAQIAQATPRTEVLAGQGAHVTYVTRSAMFGFPDYTTVLVRPDGAGAAVSVYARARFGTSDLGVNAARGAAWLAALEAALPKAP